MESNSNELPNTPDTDTPNTPDSPSFPPTASRGALTSLSLPPEIPTTYPLDLDLEDPPSDSELDAHLRSMDPGARHRAEIILSLLMESQNIQGGTGHGFDIPELKRPIEYRLPRRLVRYNRRGGVEEGQEEQEDEGEGEEGKEEEGEEGERMGAGQIMATIGEFPKEVEGGAGKVAMSMGFDLRVKDETMDLESAKIAAEKAIKELTKLDFGKELKMATEKVEALELESKGKGKGKEKARSTTPPPSRPAISISQPDDDGDQEEDIEQIERGIYLSIKDSHKGSSSSSRNGESSGSVMTIPHVDVAELESKPKPLELWPEFVENAPIPDLWPESLPEDEAKALNVEDASGPLVDPSFILRPISESLHNLISTSKSSPHYPAVHHILSNSYQQYFRQSNDKIALEAAFLHARLAVSMMPPNRIVRRIAVVNLAEIHNLAWLSTNAVPELSAAINLLERTMEGMDPEEKFLIPVTIFLSRLYARRYDALRMPEDLEMNITLAERITLVNWSPMLMAGNRASGISIPDLHFQLAKRLREAGKIERAIERFEIAAALTGEGEDDMEIRAAALQNRADTIHANDPGNTAATIAALQTGIEALPPNHPTAAIFKGNLESLVQMGPGDEITALRAKIDSDDGDLETLTDLARSLYVRFRRGQDIRDLEGCIEPAEIAFAATGEEEKESYLLRAGLLAQALQTKYEVLGQGEDLDRSIITWEAALKIADGEEHLAVMSNMSQAHYSRHKHGSGAADVDIALMYAKAASEGTPRSHPEYAGRLLNLANCYTGRFRVYGTRGDIDTGIATMRHALDSGEEDGSTVDRPGVMGNLAGQLCLRFQAFRDRKDIDECVEWAERSYEATNTHKPHYLERVLNLATMYELRDRGQDLEQSVHLTRTALQGIPKGHRILAGTLMQLAERIKRLHGKGEEGLHAGVRAAERAAAAVRVGHPDHAAVLATLAVSYRNRYERLGGPEDLERAVETGYTAVAHAKESTAMKGENLSILSELLSIRHRRTGATEDMELAVKTAREALDCTPVEHLSRPQRLIELCERLIERYKRFRDTHDLLGAITMGNLCLERTTERDQNHCRRLYIVAEALHRRHTDFKTFWNDLDRAMIMAQNAKVLYPTGSRNIRMYEIDHLIGRILRSMYRRDREPMAIDQAIVYLEAAATAIDDEHPERADILDSLARCYLIRYQAQGNTGPDAERSFVTFRDAYECETAAPLTRIRAAQRMAYYLERSQRWKEAADMYEECVKLMPRVTPPSLSRTDQEALIRTLFEIPLRAAAAAFEAGRGAERALRVLELGRGIMRGFTMDCRSDMSDLQNAHPDLYAEFDMLRRELDSTVRVSTRQEMVPVDLLVELGEESMLARRKRAVQQLEEVLVKIRGLDGYENFLLPPTGAELRKMAADGPIVVYSSFSRRCDAIIVTTDSIRSIKLPQWRWGVADKHIADMMFKYVRGSVSSYAQRNKNLQVAVKWLWDAIVEPVLDELGITGEEEVMPKIWWVASGPLNFAPLHAAGDHAVGSKKNTISRVISSYIPSIKALGYARQKKRPSGPTGAQGILIVKMPTTPGLANLHGVEKEATHIMELVGEESTKILTHPTASEVLGQLSSHSAVHFACHGLVDKSSPSHSSLILQNRDGGQDRLTVQMVSEATSEAAQVAYLSACSTAESLEGKLAEETIHLAGAFMLAGFRNVVATLWESNDEACVCVAGAFYRGLLVEGYGSAEAVHRAVVELRRRRPGKVLMWAPFVHTGA